MWPFNSPFSSKLNQSSFTIKSSLSDKIKDNNSKDLFNEISFQTPLKEIKSNITDNNNLTPFKIGFNYYLANLFSSEPAKVNPINNLFNSSSHNSLSKDKNKKKERKSNERSSYKLSPNFYYMNNKSINSMNSNSFSSEYIKIQNSNINQDELTHKNLSLLFNDIKDDNSFYNNNENDNNFFMKNIAYKYEDKDNILINNNSNSNNSINSCKNNSSKKIFECSNSTSIFSSMSFHKRRRIRKNNEQLFLLRKFYSEHKCWNKNQIKEISHLTGINENKVYKWLWDQRNKESKHTRFTVNKNVEKKINK